MARPSEGKWLADVMRRLLEAYGAQGCPIGDSDLDDEQPLNLRIRMRLGDIRRARGYIQKSGVDIDTALEAAWQRGWEAASDCSEESH